MNSWRKTSGAFDRTLDIFGVMSSVLLIVMMLAVSVKVVFRYILRIALTGVDELSEVALLYITFLGTAWLLRREGHVSIDIIFGRLKRRTQTQIIVATSMMGAIFFLVLVWFGIVATLDAWHRGVVTPTILELPKGAILIIIPLGSLLLVVQFLRRAWAHHTGGKPSQNGKVG